MISLLPMMTNRFSRRVAIGTFAIAGLLCVSQGAQAKSSILTAWNAVYPSSQSAVNAAGAGSSCNLCHQSLSPRSFNGYGWAIRININAGMSNTNAILAAESADSDNDPTGSSNLVEITADTQPGYTTGANNTWFFEDGTTTTNQMPPAGILGSLDPVPNPWTDLGNGLAGTGGVTPVLTGTGTLMPGTPFGITLSNALPSSQAFLFIGLSQANLPFRGGTLVPTPDFFVPGLPVNGAGQLVIGANWPGLPSGTAVYFQYWVVDPVGPFGASASNGLSGVTF